MTLRKSWLIGSPVDGEGVPTEATATAQDGRVVHAGLFAQDAAGLVRAGVLGNPGTIVFDRSDMAVDIDAFTAVLSRGALDGAVPVANDGLVSVTLPAAPSSNSRVVRVYVLHHDDVDGADVDNEPIFGVAVGAAAATPAWPALPAGALPFVRITQPANVLGTADCTVVQEFPMTAAAGGVVPCRTVAERDVWTPSPGSVAQVLANGRTYVRRGTAWRDTFPLSFFVSQNSDGNGYVAVPHTLGVAPDWVQVTRSLYGSDALDLVADLIVVSVSSTQVILRYIRRDTNAWFAGNPVRAWMTIGIN